MLVATMDPAALELPPGKRIGQVLRLDQSEGRALRNTLGFLWKELCSDSAALGVPQVAHQFEDALFSVAELTCGSSAFDSTGSHPRGRVVGRRVVDRARDYIHAHLRAPISCRAIAASAGVSDRTLRRSFERELQQSPLQYVYEQRLDCARQKLKKAEPGSLRITDLAYDLGFSSPGRFAARYRSRFGEPPSETLRSR